MNITKFLSLALVVVIAFSSCGGSKADAMAGKVCSCMEPMVGLVADMKAAQAANDMTKVAEVGQKLQEAQGKMTCLADLEKEGKEMEGKMKDDEKKKFEEDMKAALTKKCPKVAEMMNGGM